MSEGLLVMHDRIVNRQAKQDSGEADTDDIDRTENQPTQRQGAAQNQRQ